MGIKFDSKTNTWVASWQKRHPITRQPKSLRRIGLKSEAEAKRTEKQLVIQIEESFRKQDVPTWKELVTEFISEASILGLGAGTIMNYETCLNANTMTIWSNRLIDSVTPHEIREVIRGPTDSKKPAQQKNILKYIKGVFCFAVDKGYIKSNPTPKIKVKTYDKVKKVLTVDQVRIFLNKAREYDHEWYPHWALAVYTGMRNGELYALTWDKIDFENNHIKVESSWTKKTGFKSTKSGNDRIVGISQALLPLLKQLKLEGGSRTWVLPRLRDWDHGDQARQLQKFLLGIGLPLIRYHDLRATWATILLSRGVEPVKVMKMGGWSELKVLQLYLRMAGIDTRGTLDNFVLHEPTTQSAKVLNLPVCSDP